MLDEMPDAYLTIRFEGPAVRPGRMRLDDFLRASREFSECAKRVALALHGQPNATRGRRQKGITDAISLDIIGITHGSPAVVAHLERTEDLGSIELTEKTYNLLLLGIERAGEVDSELPRAIDAGVLTKIRDLGRVFDKGVSRIEFRLNHRAKPITVSYDRRAAERVDERLSRAWHPPEIEEVVRYKRTRKATIEGKFLMADFNEDKRVIRVHPARVILFSVDSPTR